MRSQVQLRHDPAGGLAALRRCLAAELRQVVGESGDDFPAIAWVWRALQSRGKLLSEGPGFCWGLLPPLVCEAASGDPDRAVPIGTALECLVAAADTADDVQDQDSPDGLWRACGIPTATNVVVYLLFLYQLALGRLSSLGIPVERVAEIQGSFARAGARACAGQQQDLDLRSGESLGEEDYLAMTARKSAASVECACRAGALVASAEPSIVEACAGFGFNLGMALQIRNDVAGASSARSERADLWTGKVTLPIIFALDCSPPDRREQIVDILRLARSRRLDRDEVDRLASLLASARALDYAAVVADVYWERALGQLRSFANGREWPLVAMLGETPDA